MRSAGGWVALQELRKSRKNFASDERILGSSAFVAAVLKKANEDYARKTRAAIQDLDLDRLSTMVCDHLGLNPSLLKTPAKQSAITRARAVMSHIAFDTLRLRGVDIARWLEVTPAAVSRLAGRGRADPLADKIEKLISEEA